MASRSSSSSKSAKPSLRNTPAEKPAGRSASTGGRATKSAVRSDMNSRSSNSGRQKKQASRGDK